MTAMTVFNRAHAFVAQWEGGYSNHPADSGGPTNYGVSLAFLRDQGYDVGDIDGDGDIDIDDIKAITPEDAKVIFRHAFWVPEFNLLADTHPRCAMACYDTAVNMGLGYAKRLLQQAVGTKADGIWGPKTWAAIKGSSDFIAVASMIEMRKVRYVEIADRNPKNVVFLKGWLNRANALAKAVSEI